MFEKEKGCCPEIGAEAFAETMVMLESELMERQRPGGNFIDIDIDIDIDDNYNQGEDDVLVITQMKWMNKSKKTREIECINTCTCAREN
jgi:hypothetical protein